MKNDVPEMQNGKWDGLYTNRQTGYTAIYIFGCHSCQPKAADPAALEHGLEPLMTRRSSQKKPDDGKRLAMMVRIV
jgi:hypothetical protein